ncbi:hypothetical protein Tsubulata_042185, partial [Turnera subulata]
MREEVISSGGTMDPTPAASSAGASSAAVPANARNDSNSKAAALSGVGGGAGSQLAWASSGVTSRPSCRPWERGDLLRRLATFKPSNWFGKPKGASSLACAQRGWMNTDVDKIVCETCGACLSFALLPSWTPEEVDSAVEAFAKQLDVGHQASCPWRGNSCPESLVQFPPTPQSALIGGYKDRCDGLLQFQILPIVAASAAEQMRVSRGPPIDRLLSQSQSFTSGEGDFKTDDESSRDGTSSLYSRSQKLISLCGWEPRWLPNIQDCEEHSAQSARNGCSFGPAQAQVNLAHDPGPSKKAHSATAKKGSGKNKLLAAESRYDSRSPLLDCSLCGSTVRIGDFSTVPRPSRFTTSTIDIPDASKKMALTRGVSAASGISGWVAADDMDKEQVEDRDEVATTDKGKLLLNTDVDLNLTMGGSLSASQADRIIMPENIHGTDMGRDLVIGQPVDSEVGDRAASYESRGPSSRKRSLEIGGSSDDRAHLITQPADSVEGTVIDRDAEEVTDGRQFSAGPSKRARDSDIFDTFCSPYHRDSSGAGPSHSVGREVYTDGTKAPSFRQGIDRTAEIPSTRDSTRASSVIAMDTICHSADDDSMESVENYPGDVYDVHFPSSSAYGNLDMNETSELNNSNQAQQSICFQPTAEAAPGEMGVSSTNDGEEIFNAETVTAQARDGFSFGISGGSVGMCASHEAEIHGADVSVHRTDSVVGDVEPRIEDVENQGQTGESAPDPGLMDEIIPDEINREDPHGDSQEMLSRSVERADSGSKIDGSVKAESVESGEKASQSCKLPHENNAHPSLSCNANIYYSHETSKKGLVDAGKSSSINNCPCAESDNAATNGIGPPKGESNYEESVEFDPIAHHNKFCPWVNGNVAAAGCSSRVSGNSADAAALCGWQLTLDALDALRTSGNIAIQTVQSESAASLHKEPWTALTTAPSSLPQSLASTMPPTSTTAALRTSCCLSSQKQEVSSNPQQPNVCLSVKPRTLLQAHPLYISAEKNVSLEIREKILCLEIMGIDSGKALAQNPSLHSASVDSVHSIISFLESKGIRQKDFARIIGMCPRILTSDVKADLIPVFKFLNQELGVPDKDYRKVINKCPRLLVSSVEDQLKPCLFYLQRLGFKNLKALAYQDSVLLVSSVENTLIPKLKYLQSLGLSRDETVGMVLRCPALFTFSVENNMKPKFEYFAREMKGKLEELKEFPHYFTFSLDKRIKPRHLEVVQGGFKMPLPIMLKSTDQEFEELMRQGAG